VSKHVFAGQLFADMLSEYRRRCTEVVVDVSFEDRYVDLVDEGFDLALRVTADSPPGGLIARPVRPLTVLVGASHRYLEQHGTPKSPEDLAAHDCVGIGSWDSWVFEGEKGRVVVPARTVVRYRTLVGAANAVSAGIGLVPLPLIGEPESGVRCCCCRRSGIGAA
jgi:DNA-binding transcriptional LysR family regulator